MSNLHPWRRKKHANEDEQELIEESQHPASPSDRENDEEDVDDRSGKSSGDSRNHCSKKKKKFKQFILRKLGRREKLSPPKETYKDEPPPMRRPDYDDYYDGDVAPSGCYICCINSSSLSSSRMAPSAQQVGPKKPSSSSKPSYYDFVKILLERNDFYSNECNVHQEIHLPAGT